MALIHSFMRRPCGLCDDNLAYPNASEGFCLSCEEQLDQLAGAAPGRQWLAPLGKVIHYSLPYTPLVRRLILNIKAGGKEHAAIALWDWLTVRQRPATKLPDLDDVAAAHRQFYGVMPCPSSLWGRLRGRLDLAGWLAHRLATQYELPLLTPPLQLRFRLQKRAQQGSKLARQSDPPRLSARPLLHSSDHHAAYRNPLEKPHRDKVKPILLVDDVLTTGQTMAEVAALLPASRCYVLALA